MQQHGEPSVEEILQSIKKVIARDNRTAARAERERRKHEGVVVREAPLPEPGFDLAEAESREGPDTPEPADADEAGEILDLGAAGAALFDNADTEFADATARPAPAGAAAADGEDENAEDLSLTTERVAESMRESLSALAMFTQPEAEARPAASGTAQTSLEGLVREMLRPMLARWLDENLPNLVERLVRAEIERISGRQR